MGWDDASKDFIAEFGTYYKVANGQTGFRQSQPPDYRNVEIIYVPSDHTKEEYEEFMMSHPDWYGVPWEMRNQIKRIYGCFDASEREQLGNPRQVCGIPSLVIVQCDGCMFDRPMPAREWLVKLWSPFATSDYSIPVWNYPWEQGKYNHGSGFIAGALKAKAGGRWQSGPWGAHDNFMKGKGGETEKHPNAVHLPDGADDNAAKALLKLESDNAATPSTSAAAQSAVQTATAIASAESAAKRAELESRMDPKHPNSAQAVEAAKNEDRQKGLFGDKVVAEKQHIGDKHDKENEHIFKSDKGHNPYLLEDWKKSGPLEWKTDKNLAGNKYTFMSDKDMHVPNAITGWHPGSYFGFLQI